MRSLTLFITGMAFVIMAVYTQNDTARPHLLTLSTICFVGFIIVCEIKDKK